MRGEGVMTNIPTELLRTLVAVVDLRSFTKAAQSLGVTQPAVSAQIKRLQGLLGTDLLDKSAPGVSLTSAGELVVNYARRLLSINDQILDIAGPRAGGKDGADRRDRRLHRVRHRARADLLARAPARSALRGLQRQHRRAAARPARRRRRSRDLGFGDRPDDRHPALLDRAAGLGARAVDADRSEPSGAAGVLRRGMPVHAQRHGGAEPGRPRMRADLHRLEPARARRRGGGGLRRHGAAAQPRRHSRHHGLGRRATAQAAGHLLRHLCARRRRCGRARADRRHASPRRCVRTSSPASPASSSAA